MTVNPALSLALVAAMFGPTNVRPQQAHVPAATAIAPMTRPAVVRGLYVNRWAVLGQKMWELIGVAKRTEANALVLGVKDDRGLMLYRSTVPLARQIGADTSRPVSAARMRAILDTMRAYGIFPIARIVVAKDPLLAVAKPEWAVQRRADGKPWLEPPVSRGSIHTTRECERTPPTFRPKRWRRDPARCNSTTSAFPTTGACIAKRSFRSRRAATAPR